MSVADSGRKRAGEWLNSELDLDDFKHSKRYRQQEIACDLSGMHLEQNSCGGACAGAAGAGGSAPEAPPPCPAAGEAPPPRPAASVSSLQTSMQTSAAEGGSPQAMQCTPRSESRTPSVHKAGGGGGGQPTVHSGGRLRMAARPTPMRLLDTLNAHPTSPSDPVLEGQLDLRKATLMRSLQTRLLRNDTDISPPAPTCTVAVGALDARHQQPAQQRRQQQPQQPAAGPPGEGAQQQRQQQQQQQQAGGARLAPAAACMSPPSYSSVTSMSL